MAGITQLFRSNRNYRYLWSGQVVSEVGDHFNNIAVFSLALQYTGSGMAVAGVLIARAISAVAAGPLAGVILDRLDRRVIMITSDLIRGLMALGFILCVWYHSVTLLYIFSALLMFASPFFTSGRSSILPNIVTREEMHAANSITQTTSWSTTCVGAFLGGTSVAAFGYEWAFLLNAFSFFFSAFCVSQLRAVRGSFQVVRDKVTELEKRNLQRRHWHEYKEGIQYLRSIPLLFAIAMLSAGWAIGGGAAQVLFTLFGEIVFKRGPQGIGILWGAAGLGLVLGGITGHTIGPKLSFPAYRRTISIVYLLHGICYITFSQMTNWYAALFFIGASRATMAVSSVLNMSQLLHHVAEEYRGRVFATIESITWSVMMLSLCAAGVASQSYSPRTIGAFAGLGGLITGTAWAAAVISGKLVEPPRKTVTVEEETVDGEQLIKSTT